ncbi:MAG TPA: glycosyltransferase [Acidimicrobiales bacterium]|nr:glycosyltransferase [Acidimicrobiales bacterium]
MSAPGPTVVVVPCFNEERRLDERAFTDLVAGDEVRLVFVDDGSTDATGRVLDRLAAGCEGIEVVSLAANTGKAEAVRRGLLVAVRGGAGTVGYYDADLATPPAELLRLTRQLHARPELAGVFGSRVARLGSSIERKALRHYLGRAYATVASIALGVTVYDTQCGAKVFRVTDTLVAALAEPFRTSWAFDVELLDRLLHGSGDVPGVPVTRFLEVPLETWRDVTGSKLRVAPAFDAFVDLVTIARRRARRSRPPGGPGPGTAGTVRALRPRPGSGERRATPGDVGT